MLGHAWANKYCKEMQRSHYHNDSITLVFAASLQIMQQPVQQRNDSRQQDPTILASNVTLRNPAGPTFALPEKLLRTRTNSNGTSAALSSVNTFSYAKTEERKESIRLKMKLLRTVEEAAAFTVPGTSLP